MASRKLKRPSSARRNIKFESFSQYVSATRLRHVQSLLESTSSNKADSPDAILCISGIDCRYNDGMRELINYLLFGFFDVRKAELESSGFEDEVIDDIILLVKKNSVDVYCNPVNYHYLMPYLSHWYNIRFHCMTDQEYEDEEEAEEFKIRSFIKMTEDCHRVGIPYSSSAHIHQFDKFAVEKWPIVQAFALEGLGGGGFFTMVHEVLDVSTSVHQLYSKMDPVSLEVLLTDHLPLLQRQWNNMTATVEIEITNNGEKLNEEKLFEPLRSYFQHGSATTGDAKINRKVPFVLFGSHSNKSELLQVQEMEGFKSRRRATQGQTTHTILCQAVDPKGPLTCARTYFFTPLYDPFIDQEKSAESRDSDNGYLMLVYKAMIEGVMAGIETYSTTLSVTQARLKAVQTLHDLCGDLKTSSILDYLSNRSNVKFTIEAVDSNGRPSSLQDGQQSLLVKVATITLFDIPSSTPKGRQLGSLIFAESFIDSVIPVKDNDMPESLNSDHLVLTSPLPRFHMWPCSQTEQGKRRELEERLHNKTEDRFGSVLMSGETVELTTGAAVNIPPQPVSLYVYSSGLVVYSPQYGAFSLLPEHIRNLSLFDGDTISDTCVVLVDLYVTARPRLPPHLLSPGNRLIIVVPPHSKARKALYQEVLPHWKEEGSKMPAAKRLDNLPEDLQHMYDLVQIQHSTASQIISPINVMSFKRVPSILPYLHSFLSHFTASSVGWSPVPKSELNALLNLGSPPQEEADWILKDTFQITVTIISGIPGCHKENLVRTITSMDKENTRWTTICQPHDSTAMFDPISLQNSLTSAYSANRRLHTSGTYKRTRVIILTPGYTDILDVVHAVVTHPKPEVAAQIRIGSVTACIDPLNTFMQHRLTFPNLLNHCAQGWVNCIVFTSTRGEMLDEIQNLVRSVNTDVALLLADKGNVTRSPDLELIMSETTFHLPAMVSARYLLHPGWRQGKYLNTQTVPRMNRIVLKFSQPLNRTKLHSNLRALRSALSPWKMEGNIYHVEGTVKFTDSRQFIEVEYRTLSGGLTSAPAEDQTLPPSRQMSGEPLPDCYLTFSGCGLQENSLKDWLRTCAYQKPEKKKPISRKELTSADIAKIHKTHHLESLPEGWFYNGTQFISMSGDKADTHPNLEEFVSSWIQNHNEEVVAYNTKIDAEPFTDLFD